MTRMVAQRPSVDSLGSRVVPRCRVVIDNDWAGDPDGLIALAHHLLSPGNVVEAVTSSFLNPMLLTPGRTEGTTAAAGTQLARQLLDLVAPPGDRPACVTGAEQPFTGSGTSTAASSLICERATAESELPLVVVCAGPLTNVAQAIAQDPQIVTRLTLVWIGGSESAEVYEYNRDTDPEAARYVLSRSGLVVHRFPLTTYRQCAYSIAELECDLPATGRVGAWLYERCTDLPDWLELGGVWPLGDSPPLLVTALSAESSEVVTAVNEHGVTVHEWTRVDWRLLVGDLLARLRLHEARFRALDAAQ